MSVLLLSAKHLNIDPSPFCMFAITKAVVNCMEGIADRLMEGQEGIGFRRLQRKPCNLSDHIAF